MLYQTEYTHGGDIYSGKVLLDFSSNINPLGTPDRVLKAMRDAVDLAGHYPDPYCRDAVKSISTYENVPPETILIGNGAAELIYAYCFALQPRKALIPVPAFLEYAAALQSAGCEICEYALDRNKDFLPDEDFLRCIEVTSPEVLFLCSPNNPTGQLIPPDYFARILDLCSRKKIRVLADECFIDLSDSRYDFREQIGSHGELLILKAFTKNFALPAIRIGYCLCSDEELLRKMSRMVQPWNVSVIAQAAAAAAVHETDYLEKARRLISTERARMAKQFESLGFWVCPSHANFLLFQAPVGLDDALRREGIAIRCCANYSGLGPGWYRTAVRKPEENQTLMEAVRRAVSGRN